MFGVVLTVFQLMKWIRVLVLKNIYCTPSFAVVEATMSSQKTPNANQKPNQNWMFASNVHDVLQMTEVSDRSTYTRGDRITFGNP